MVFLINPLKFLFTENEYENITMGTLLNKTCSVSQILRITTSLIIFCSLGIRAQSIAYLFPIPGTHDLPVQSPVILRLADADPKQIINLETAFRLSGDISGSMTGNATIASDGKTVLFHSHRPYEPNETVYCRITLRFLNPAQHDVDTSYTFITADFSDVQDPVHDFPDTELSTNMTELLHSQMTGPDPVKINRSQAEDDPLILGGVSVPYYFPKMNITINNNPDDGHIFIVNQQGPCFASILDNNGAPLWYWKPSDTGQFYDFKQQPNGLLTMATWPWNEADHCFFALDGGHVPVNTYKAAAGYATDNHELQILENGNYLLIGRHTKTVDMSLYITGGQPDAKVRETVLQEFTEQHEMIFIWRAWDHFDIRDMQSAEDPLTGASIRFPHMNAIDVDEDGHLLLSSRHLSEITKINRQTGEIIWRLGGKNNQFTFIDDPLNGFTSQHDIRSLGNNRYTLFDNGNNHVPQISRAVEYELDTGAETATLVWEFRDTPDKYSHFMGNVQRLLNGNTLIHWGHRELPLLTEVTPEGEKAFEMNYAGEYTYEAYRVFRFPWHGQAPVPYLQLEYWVDRITLLFNKFGDSNVARYNIYADQNPAPETLVASSSEPFIHLRENVLENNKKYYFRVTAVDYAGNESGFSNELWYDVQFRESLGDLVQNGDFSEGFTNWSFMINNGADAVGDIEEEQLVYKITNGGAELRNVSLRQRNIRLFKGRTYRLEFDAKAESGRLFEVEVIQSTPPYTNYSRMGLSWLTNRMQHFTHEFVMDFVSDFPYSYEDALLVLNAGASTIDVTVDNISIKRMIDEDPPVADFSADITFGIAPLDVQFADRSTGVISSWYWDFGDGTEATEATPSHRYTEPGVYSVSLTVTGPAGTDSKIRQDYIQVDDGLLAADFFADTTRGFVPFKVQFTDLSQGFVNSWAWDLGDGNFSADQNPSHTYLTADTFSVSLTVTGPGGENTATKTDYIQVEEAPPVAAFTADTTIGIKRIEVRFQDQSTGVIDTWLWDFGDGTTGTVTDPFHDYTQPGVYTVSLSVSGPGGSDTEIKENFIRISEQKPIASFSADTTIGIRPLDVQFSDNSAGNINSWFWDFGDSTTSPEQNPSHTYMTADSFSVSLLISGPGGADTLSRVHYITVLEPPPIADFSADTTRGLQPLEVQFNDMSSGLIDNWLWNFGDGKTSTEQNPSYRYVTAGTFTVSLTVTGPGGGGTKTKEHYINVNYPPPAAHFEADTTTGTPPFEVQFSDHSDGTVLSWLWDFGDGSMSELQNPAHIFMTPDTFTVSLTISGPGGTDTTIRESFIQLHTLSARTDEFASMIPEKYSLLQNYPNPFNPQTRITFTLPEKDHVSISCFNLNGKKISDPLKGKQLPAGVHSIIWDATRHPAGTYFIRMFTKTWTGTVKSVLIK